MQKRPQEAAALGLALGDGMVDRAGRGRTFVVAQVRCQVPGRQQAGADNGTVQRRVHHIISQAGFEPAFQPDVPVVLDRLTINCAGEAPVIPRDGLRFAIGAPAHQQCSFGVVHVGAPDQAVIAVGANVLIGQGQT